MTRYKAGIILSGCGYIDGAEIQESVITMLAVDRIGAEAVIAAPDIAHKHIVNHLTGRESAGETRNVLVEAARITRGAVIPLKEMKESMYDVLLIPGGYGAAKNLSDFAFNGKNMTVLPELEELIRDTYHKKKPIGFICITPVIAAKVLGDGKLKLTIGNDPETATAINAMGGVHIDCPVNECVIDTEHMIVSTPAYMLGPNVAGVAAGIEKLVNAVFNFL